MSDPTARNPEDVISEPAKVQFETFIDQHRESLNACLDGLSEEQARRSLVASKTTLLGLVKHATFVEKVWFGEAVTGRTRDELGIEPGPDESFDLRDDDTVATVRKAHRDACKASRQAVANLELTDLLPGNRRGPLPLRWVYLHVLRELAQHCGHADILSEQVMRGGPSDSPPPYFGDYPHGAYWSAIAPEGSAGDEAEDYTVEGTQLRIMWDEGAGPLWGDEGLLPDEPDWLRQALGLSDALITDLLGWVHDMDTARERGQPQTPIEDRAVHLTERLHTEVGSRFRVRFHR